MNLINVSTVLASLLFAGIGVLVFAIGFVILDKMTPYHLWKEIVEKQNTALAIMVGALSIGLAIIIAAAVVALAIVVWAATRSRNRARVLENFGPGTIERLCCSWEDLREINPRLVYLSMKGFLKGPYEHRGALDEVVQMQSGLAYMTGPPGRPRGHRPGDGEPGGGVRWRLPSLRDAFRHKRQPCRRCTRSAFDLRLHRVGPDRGTGPGAVVRLPAALRAGRRRHHGGRQLARPEAVG